MIGSRLLLPNISGMIVIHELEWNDMSDKPIDIPISLVVFPLHSRLFTSYPHDISSLSVATQIRASDTPKHTEFLDHHSMNLNIFLIIDEPPKTNDEFLDAKSILQKLKQHIWVCLKMEYKPLVNHRFPIQILPKIPRPYLPKTARFWVVFSHRRST